MARPLPQSGPFDFTTVTRGHERFPAGVRTHRGADSARAAVAEILLRTVPPDSGYRTVRRAAVRGARASAVATAADLELVSLCDGPDLAAVGQNAWLITTRDCATPEMAVWTKRLREAAPTAAGVIWPPVDTPRDRLVLLFEDRVDPAEVFLPDPVYTIDLDDEIGAIWLSSHLVHYKATLNPPKAR